MKRITLTFVAVSFAGLCLAVKSHLATMYYWNLTPGSIICVNAFTGTVCPSGTADQCSVVAGDDIYWITKKVDLGPCVLHRRHEH